VTDAGKSKSNLPIPTELQQDAPRNIRLSAAGIYLFLANMLISAFMLAIAVGAFSMTTQNIAKGKLLARDGQVAYTGDVQSAGMHLATVHYSFNYNGQAYRGEALLPKRYLSKINDYSKAGNFRVLFLPRDPSINHPYDWQDDESYSFPFISYVFVALLILQWSGLIRYTLPDFRLARTGVVAIGRVTNCSYGSRGISLKYEFRDSDGLPMEGRSGYPRRLEEDTPICILYLPNDSGRNRPYPLTFFRAAK
jgi:hypothetical protein